jgi:hypothetical protein
VPVGYSGKPLAQKLGLKPGHRVVLLGAPPEFEATLAPVPDGTLVERAERAEGADVLLLFTREAAALRREFPAAAAVLPAGGMLWIAWPKKAAKQRTDVDENVVREIGLATGLVDVKVCAIDELWSGLKFVHRKAATSGRA